MFITCCLGTAQHVSAGRLDTAHHISAGSTKQPFVSHNSAENPEKLSSRKTACLYICFHLLSRRITRVISTE
jgi:hypothetical protein